VLISDDVSTRINIKKRRERVVYRTLSNQDNINIAYLIGQEINPSSNLFISDRSTSLTQNRIPSVQDQRILTSSAITANVDKFLVTDIFTEETPTQAEVPLYLVHTLKNFNPDLANFSGKTLLSLEFADYRLKPIRNPAFLFVSSTGEVFNNIENTFNSSTRAFTATYIKYTVRTISGPTQTIDIHHELVDNLPVYNLAEFEDLDEFGNLLPGVKKYIVEEEPGGQRFNISMPTSARYAFKETPESRIKILPPTAIDLESPWTVRVTNGQFITSLKESFSMFATYKYRIAEFNSQLFSPYPPFKFQPEEKEKTGEQQ